MQIGKDSHVGSGLDLEYRSHAALGSSAQDLRASAEACEVLDAGASQGPDRKWQPPEGVALRRADPDEITSLSALLADVFPPKSVETLGSPEASSGSGRRARESALTRGSLGSKLRREVASMAWWLCRLENYASMMERIVITSFETGLRQGEGIAHVGPHALAGLFVVVRDDVSSQAPLPDDQYIGMVELYCEEFDVPDAKGHKRLMACVGNLAVRREYRGAGLGRALLKQCEEAALEAGCSEIFLSAYVDNVGALRLYNKAGYICEGVDPLLRKRRRAFLRKRLSAYAPPARCDMLRIARQGPDAKDAQGTSMDTARCGTGLQDIGSESDVSRGVSGTNKDGQVWVAEFDLGVPGGYVGELNFVEQNFGVLAPFVTALGMLVGFILF